MAQQWSTRQWAEAILTNDEESSDEELVNLFRNEGIAQPVAEWLIRQRAWALTQSVPPDGWLNDRPFTAAELDAHGAAFAGFFAQT